MAVLPARPRRADRLATRAMKAFAEFVIARRRVLLWASGAAIAALAFGTTRIVLDDDFIRYFDESHEIRVASDFMEDNLTGLNMLEYSVPAGREGGVSDPAYLADLERFAEWFREQPKVRHVNVLTDVVKRLNQNLHGDDPAWYRIPDSAELAAQYLLLYELSLPLGLDLNNTITVGKSASRVSVSVVDISSAEMRALDERAEAWLAANAPALATRGTGLSLVFSHISERNIQSMLGGSIMALVLISLVLVAALRSVRIGLVSLVPNLFPAAMAFGLWGYAVGNVGLAIAVVATMTLGIVVDDTVHFLSKYLRARREHGMDAVAATRFAFNTVGMALWGHLGVPRRRLPRHGAFGVQAERRIGADERHNHRLRARRRLPVPAAAAHETGGAQVMTPLLSGLLLAVAVLFASAPPAAAETPEEKGLRIAGEAVLRDEGFGDSEVALTMVLRNRHGEESVRRFRTRTLELIDDGDKTLSVFDEPADVRGTALLTHTHKTGDDDQWLYLPALKRVKRIGSSNRSGSFVGSEFSYEDLSSQEVEKYTYRWLREEPCPGAPELACQVTERFPVGRRFGLYAAIVVDRPG